MTLIVHIIIALSSIGLTTYAYFQPSPARLRRAYAAIALTFISGSYLVVMTPSHILQACISGLVYLGVVSVVSIAARNKLARSKSVTS